MGAYKVIWIVLLTIYAAVAGYLLGWLLRHSRVGNGEAWLHAFIWPLWVVMLLIVGIAWLWENFLELYEIAQEKYKNWKDKL